MANCGFQDRIRIGNHNLDCSGGVLQARYRDTQSNKFDGVHMYGVSGQKAYTDSVVDILKSVQLLQAQPPKYYSELDHQTCQQARYQAKMRNIRVTHLKSKVTHQKSYNRHTNTEYAVPTYNRYSKLADFYPGN